MFAALGTRLLHALDPETAHRIALLALARGLVRRDATPDPPILAAHLWDRVFANPIGLAAGFDKNGLAIDGALALGVGFAEIGGVTPRPQAGNPRPRLFRLSEDRAIINRLGLNSDGADPVAARVTARRRRDRPLGVNLASNTDSTDPVEDFAQLVARFAPIADFLTVDISCPNTRDGQQFLEPKALARLLARLTAVPARKRTAIPLLVKLSPDLEPERLARLVETALEGGVDGFVATNTTRARPSDLMSRHGAQAGGLSGRPLLARSTATLREVYRLCQNRVPIIGVGGVASALDAYAKLRAGASLVELYSALVYAGPGLIGRIKRELATMLERDGFATLAEAVGADHR
ncbi:MAG: quinone-dependent dihydroorotate dehydrogenase [Alphaproteobacteria bacterium]|nr:quinone-dependent dihydroorotate dehydrogenase [Alphaproteobacteria bacterium]